MTGAMRAPTAVEAVQVSQQVQTAKRQLHEAQDRHASELLLARQAVHHKWKQFHELALKKKGKELEKALKDKDKEMEKKMDKEMKGKDKTRRLCTRRR